MGVEILPAVANSARCLLCVPASVAQSERDFSVTGILTERRRAKLSGKHINAILFLDKNKSVIGEVTENTVTEQADTSCSSAPLPVIQPGLSGSQEKVDESDTEENDADNDMDVDEPVDDDGDDGDDGDVGS